MVASRHRAPMSVEFIPILMDNVSLSIQRAGIGGHSFLPSFPHRHPSPHPASARRNPGNFCNILFSPFAPAFPPSGFSRPFRRESSLTSRRWLPKFGKRFPKSSHDARHGPCRRTLARSTSDSGRPSSGIRVARRRPGTGIERGNGHTRPCFITIQNWRHNASAQQIRARRRAQRPFRPVRQRLRRNDVTDTPPPSSSSPPRPRHRRSRRTRCRRSSTARPTPACQPARTFRSR